MALMDRDNRYGAISRALHWSMAVLLLFMLASDWWFEAFEHRVSESALMLWHQSAGALIFGLLLLRIFWRRLNRGRITSPVRWAAPAFWGHMVLYALMLLLPLSGLLAAWGEGDGVNLFGWSLWAPGPEVEWLEEAGEELHEVLANALWVMIGLHVLAALAHQYLLRDRTLSRMA